MDRVDTHQTLTPESGTNKEDEDIKRQYTSLPLYFNQSELCTLGSRTGMDCMPLRSPPGPYHYHVTDQTKSLQELQNEVGALLEFRDLVIETFPDLKHKMASISASNTITGIPSSSLASRRDWEPGIRVRRKLTQKENADISSSSLIRSRSNSHSGKKEPKSGEGNGSVVQDSGFSTETSSSKETHSASSTSGGMQGTIVTNHPAHRLPAEAEDELWNLLDVIHRKCNKLRDEVEHLQIVEKEKCRNSSSIPEMFQNQLDRLNKEDIQILRKERDRLLDKLSEMEAENIAGRIKSSKVHDEVEALHLVKRDLEEQLRAAFSQKIELNSRIHDMHQQFVSKSIPSSPESTKPRLYVPSSTRKLSTSSSSSADPNTTTAANNVQGASNQLIGNRLHNTITFSPVILKSELDNYDNLFVNSKHLKNELNLGRLDGLVSSPNRSSKVRVTDSKKFAAILLETNVVELQRHLLTLTVQNQVLIQRLEQATKSKSYLIKKLDKAKEDIDDFRFQLEERNIELEGTKAQLRILESKTKHKSDLSPEHYSSTSRDSTIIQSSQVSTPSMKAMIPLAMDELNHHHHHHHHHHHNSSSTESAQDQTELDNRIETPKKRPSKIPLPGTKGYLAPKPPTGRNSITQRMPSGPPSNRSLSKSTGSLIGRSGPNSVKKDANTNSPSINRPESAQSLRKDSSLGSRGSSIPVSSKVNIMRTNNSPVPKPKRESFTSKVRNMDSLSRIQMTPSSSTSSPSNSNSTSSLYKSNSKKDLSSSFSSGQNRDKKPIVTPVRRVSSASVGRNGGVDLTVSEPDSGKTYSVEDYNHVTLTRKVHSIQNRDLIREYMARTHVPPAIFKPSFLPFSPPSQLEIAYKHPRLLLDSSADYDESIYRETNREIEIKYVDDNSIELLVASNSGGVAGRKNFPENDGKVDKTIAFLSIGVDDSTAEKPCKLIGKVNANLVKTWEQLNGKMNATGERKPIYSRSISNESDVVLYPTSNKTQTIPNNSSNIKFYVNHVLHSESSEDFFDSIDDQYNSELQNITSICEQEDQESADLMAAAGEIMADFESLDKRKTCWSINS